MVPEPPRGRAAAIPLGNTVGRASARPVECRARPSAVGDEDLMAEFRLSADERAFEELARRHTPRTYRAALAMTGNRDDAEDAVQECFLRVIRARSSYRPGMSFPRWLFAILRNVCADEARRRLRESGGRGRASEPAGPGDPSSRLVTREDCRAACRALVRLPLLEREVLVLRIHGGLKFSEVAAICGISVEAAKKRAYRALDSLRRDLAGRG